MSALPFISRQCSSADSNIARGISQSKRALSAPAHFYQNRNVERYAAKKANRMTLRQLVWFGKSMNEERLIKSANHVRTELPVRIAHRLMDMQSLPYAVVTQEGVSRVYELYWSAFEKFRKYPQVNTIEENNQYCAFLRSMLDEHLPVIPNLYLGLSLASHHVTSEQLDTFMRRMLVSRISRRVLAEHHIALSSPPYNSWSSSSASEHVGIIHTNLSVKHNIENVAARLRANPQTVVDVDWDFVEHGGNPTEGWPDIIIDGNKNTRFSYIREHLDYIIFELLKNAIRASIDRHRELHKDGRPPAVRATIVEGPDNVAIRICDEGGGLSSEHIQRPSDLFSFSHFRNTARLEHDKLRALRKASMSHRGIKGTVREQEEGEVVEGRKENRGRVGIGLPLSNTYAGYFGGSLQLVPMDGWGTDVYLRLPKLGTNLEGIEV